MLDRSKFLNPTRERAQTTARFLIQSWRDRFRRLPLRRQLALLVLATAVPLLASTLLMFTRLSQNEQENIRSGLMVGARTLAALVDNELDTYAAIASTLSKSETLKTGNFEAFGIEARRALGFVPGTWLVLFSHTGEILYATSDRIAAGDALLPRELAASAIAAHRPLVSDLVIASAPLSPVILVSVPVYQQDRAQYVVTVSVSPARFVEIIKDRIASDQRVAIVDSTYHIIARIPGQETRLGTPIADSWRKAIEQQRTGITNTVTVEGIETLTAYTETAHRWIVGVAEASESIARPFRSIIVLTAGITLTLVLMSLALSTALSRHIGSGMSGLARAAHDIGKGRVPAVTGAAPFSEAATIYAALQDASAEIVRRDVMLSQANADLEAKVAARTTELRTEMQRREASEERVRQMEKMEAIGQLSGGIAHDFNNMLAIISSSLSLLERKLARGDHDVGKYLEAARHGTERAATLTKRLLAFARSQPLNPTPTDVNRLLAGMSELLSRTLPANIAIETVLGAGLWTVNTDANQLENALLNLVTNARDAMLAGGKLTIETQNAWIDEAYCLQHPEVTPGQYVMMAVTDTGGGMSADVVARAFEPFYTTKPSGQGTGLGLPQVYGFIKQSGGHVKIYNEFGHGVTVKVYLPRHFGPAVAREASIDVTAAHLGPREDTLVLVVEDDPVVLRGTVGLLHELGYRTAEATSGEQALELLKTTTGVRLLLTDVVMPGMNGRELADRALQADPGLKVVFATGYTRNAIVHNGIVDPDVELLAKPFTMHALSRTLYRVLWPGEPS